MTNQNVSGEEVAMQNVRRPIWWDDEIKVVKVIDQRQLPHRLVIADLATVDDVIRAIKEMYVRGAPLIGVTAAYGMVLAVMDAWADPVRLREEADRIEAARPTAVNLAWAVERVLAAVPADGSAAVCAAAAREVADDILAEEIENCRRIGEHGLELIEAAAQRKEGQPVNILTHCNAGWLACVEYGTATAPIYAAHAKGIAVHVWVDETRPLNQGARLTAWELAQQGVPHTVITDNAGGHLMQRGLVDMVIVGTDRTTAAGDVANKIGTYLKALAAKDNQVPFYVALPSSTFDWQLADGLQQIPIEERDPDEVRFVQGRDRDTVRNVLITPAASAAANFAFDVTPARLVAAFITERGLCQATAEDIRRLFPDKAVHGY